MRIKFQLIVFLLLVTISRLHAQSIDSLLNVLENSHKKDSSHVNTLLALSERFTFNYADSAFHFANRALTLATEIHYGLGVVKSLTEFVSYFLAKNDFVCAEEYGLKALHWADSLNFEADVSSIQFSMAIIYGCQNEFVKSRFTFLQLLSKAKKNEDKLMESHAIGGLAAICFNIGDYDQALEYQRQIIDIASHYQGLDIALADAVRGVAMIYHNTENFPKSDSCYQIAIKIFEKNFDMIGVVSCQIEQALNYANMDSLEEAMEFVNKAKANLEKYQFKSYDMSLWQVTGIIHLRLQNPHEAMVYFRKMLKAMDENKSFHYIFSIYANMSEAYEQLKDFETASEYINKAYYAREQYLNEGIISNLVKVKDEYDKSFQEAQITELEYGNKKKELELESSRQGKYLVGGGVFVLLGIGVLLIIGLNVKTKLSSDLSEKCDEISAQNAMIEVINGNLKDQAIRAQMNPQFVFCCLEGIQRLVMDGEIHKATQYMTSFTRLLRNTLEYSERQWITVEEEVEMLRLYIELESMQIQGQFEFRVYLAENCSVRNRDLIPSMIVQQLFIEKSVKGGATVIGDNRKLSVEFSKSEAGNVICRVTDEIRESQVSILHHHVLDEGEKSVTHKMVEQRLKVLDGQNRSKSKLEFADLLDHKKSVVGTQVILEFPQLAQMESSVWRNGLG